jgi:hypothetical protein
VRGRIVAEDGAGLEGVLVTVCGPVCFYGESEAAGEFAVQIGAHLVPSMYSTLAHARPAAASYYHRLPDAAGPLVEVGDLVLLELPSEGPLLDLEGGAQTVTSGEVTLEVPEGLRVRLDPEDLGAGDEGRAFRVRTVADELRDGFTAAPGDLDVLHALAPFEAWFQTAEKEMGTARLSFAAAGRFPPGARVDVLALGSYLYPDWVTPAAFEVVATGEVSPDGSKIELLPGEGVRHLTWIGLRAKD